MSKFAVALVGAALFFVFFLILTIPTFDYFRMLSAFFIVAGIGVLLLLVARFAITRRRTVVLKGVGRGFALRSASHAIFAAEDHVVGFPSGTFSASSSGNSILAEEFVPKGSGQIVMKFIRIPAVIAGGAIYIFSSMGVIGFFIGLALGILGLGFFLFFFVVPMVLAFVVEIAMKPVIKSKITVDSTVLPDDAVQLDFTFRGPSALLVERKVMRAFAAPVLPARFSGLVTNLVPAASSAPVASADPVVAAA